MIDRRQWEAAICKTAAYFTVCRKVRPGRFRRVEFSQFSAAKTEWSMEPKRSMLYVVSNTNDSFCLGQGDWAWAESLLPKERR
jgi:hypothetical protein